MLQLALLFFCLASYEFRTVSAWGYHGSEGPVHWGNTYPDCLKSRQSPIELTYDIAEHTTKFKNFEFSNYNSSSSANSDFFLFNNGHTVQLTIQNSSDMRVKAFGDSFKPWQIHFHWGKNNSDGSEHRARKDNHHPAEMHFVHVNTKYSSTSEAVKHFDGLLVFGTLIEVSANGVNNSLIERFVSHFDKIVYADQNTTISSFALNDFFTVDTSKYFHYNGSLTTPGCNEAVLWVVFEKFLYISQAQLDEFRKLRHDTVAKAVNQTEYLYNNYRPLQNRNGRTVYRTFGTPTWPSSTASAVVPSMSIFLAAVAYMVTWF